MADGRAAQGKDPARGATLSEAVMTHAIVIAQDPGIEPGIAQGQRWLGLLAATDNIVASSKSMRVLSPNSWLIDVDNDLLGLAAILRSCAEHRFPCHTIFLDKAPTVITT